MFFELELKVLCPRDVVYRKTGPRIKLNTIKYEKTTWAVSRGKCIELVYLG